MLLQHLSGDHRHTMNTFGNLFQALRTVIDRIEGRHIGQQGLRGADIGGGLVSADVLLAGLHRHTQRRLTARVHRHSDDASRHLTRAMRGKERKGSGEERREREVGWLKF